ncbi:MULTISPECIES: SIS domain-containing protein [Clostridium]|uniref:SIS domain-containing protein n=1 Tax=Clostridium TaxID=1485 RepID=UPI00051ABCDC|nr:MULTISPECIES: SIS domain-containing protein [Clostridium]KJZ87453.1 Galactosamine-6-phosphate isomerase [Clostridium sp. IBUN22A]KJZ88011.1 Galactosamine-6-phosphate isomerase [Clostridium sp. IBUN125C]KJZ88825.1 Galactosamine-6-phosphate isomerase [Clostridium sp. IBUN22A]KJZ92360.1 Galactosamine-6-phosphate isomerase [Clostridium sp. IBUN62F]KJZ93513.1 Galactosamine-6-phosphate isomerase [Clostridium sp. IBUN62F]
MIFGKSLEELEKIKAIFTATEIRQQPELWRETYKLILDQKEAMQRFINKNVDKNTRIVLTGAGTSDYVGDTVALELNKKLEAKVEAIATTDIVSNPNEYIEKNVKTILVSYARSGNSPESIGAYDLFENNIDDITQIVITCNKDGDLAKRCVNNEKNMLVLMPEKSNDKSFAMTSSFSCMTLATLLIFDIENIEKNKEFVEIVSSQAEEILDNRWSEIKQLVDYEAERVVYLGSGTLKGLCQEMALKNLELTSGQVTTICESVLGFRHGPKSIINDKTLVIIMATNEEYTKLYDIDLIKEIHNDLGNHKLAVITYENDEIMKENCSNYICVNGKTIPNIYKIFNYMIFGQMFGYLSSLKLNISPDNPRPDGTVNRVVKGVVIHQYK